MPKLPRYLIMMLNFLHNMIDHNQFVSLVCQYVYIEKKVAIMDKTRRLFSALCNFYTLLQLDDNLGGNNSDSINTDSV